MVDVKGIKNLKNYALGRPYMINVLLVILISHRLVFFMKVSWTISAPLAKIGRIMANYHQIVKILYAVSRNSVS